MAGPAYQLRDLGDHRVLVVDGQEYLTRYSAIRRALLPGFAAWCGMLLALGRPPSLCLPYLNLLFRKALPRVPATGS